MKYSFILPIKNRAHLLDKGLESLSNMNYDKSEMEVVIVDDESVDNIRDIISKYTGKLNIQHIRFSSKKYPYDLTICYRDGFCNPALAQNIGVRWAYGKFIILTSPEVIHHPDNLTKLDEIDGLKNKFIYGRVYEFSESELTTIEDAYNFEPDNWDGILCDWVKKGICVSVYFIGVINRLMFLNLGGIDEKYMEGFAYEDDDFGNRIVALPDMTSEYKKEIFGVHLKHDRNYQLPEGLGFNLDKKKNFDYLERKALEGWDKHIIANKGKDFGTFKVIIEHKCWGQQYERD